MAVRIRLQRKGRKKRPFYRLVAADHTSPRDGKFIEMLGTYDPLQNPPVLALKRERIQHWLDNGATPSDTAHKLIVAVDAGHSLKQRKKPSSIRRAKEKAVTRQAAKDQAAQGESEAAAG